MKQIIYIKEEVVTYEQSVEIDGRVRIVNDELVKEYPDRFKELEDE
jgi:hypothetical protein